MRAPSAAPRSMTGFARADGAAAGFRWAWELRSVNGKGLELRFRLPPGFDDLEAAARERVSGVVARGNIQIGLSLQRELAVARLRINEDLLAEVLGAGQRLAAKTAMAPPSIDGLLAIRGVVEFAEDRIEGEERAALLTALLASLGGALGDLVATRSREGTAIAAVLLTRVAEIERLAAAAEASPARLPAAIRTRLEAQIAQLLGAAPALDPDRLHQEAVLLATRADIREELDRLAAHVAAARDLLARQVPVGRQLDFLAQEFNREVNTLCAKANDRGLTAIGLELKTAVDQFREQIQNLE